MNNSNNWYDELIKPSWAPPSWLFGQVWSFLYLIIFISFAFVILKSLSKEIPLIVALPFVLNILFNLLFTPIQFGLRNNLLASIDIILVVITLAWALIAIWPYFKWVSLVNIPYLAWGVYAAMLQLNITYLNWR